MKLPSITQALAGARRAFARFPFVLLDAIVGTISALILIDFEGPPTPTFLFQVLFAAVLGLPLLTGLALTSEKRKWSRPLSVAVQVGGVVLMGLYALTVPQDLVGAPNIHAFRLVMLTIALVLFAFAVPYLRHESERGYWNFCKTLFLRILTAGLYTFVLWAGLAIALAALDNLFGVDVPGKRYGELWVLLTGVFSIWLFLSGIPDDLNGLDNETSYPKGLKIFSQYILFPLVLIYLVILYAYLGKILAVWQWPEGWVSKLILGFIATGISSLLLLHPVKEHTENKWIKWASRWFYVIIIPLLIMLFLAVWRRVSEYGITEGRYLAVATGMWLCVLVAYYIVSRKKSIRFLPTSLCVGVFIVSFGPWGMFSVSEQSQVNRLKELLTKDGILVDGRVRSNHDSISFSDTKQISSIISYLAELHGYERIQPWFQKSLKSDSTGAGSKYADAAHVAKLMGIEYVRLWQAFSGGMMVMSTDREEAMILDGYDRMLRGQFVSSSVKKREFSHLGISYEIRNDMWKMALRVAPEAGAADSVEFDLRPLVTKLVADYGTVVTDKIPHEKMAIVASGRSTAAKLWVSVIRVQQHAGELKLMSYEADIGYKIGQMK
jgi:hypothetical protein